MSKTHPTIVAAAGFIATLILAGGCQSGLARYLHEPEPIAQQRPLGPETVVQVAAEAPTDAEAASADDDMQLSEADLLAARVAAYAESVESVDGRESSVITPTLEHADAALVKPTEAVEAESAAAPVIEVSGQRTSEVQWSEPEAPAALTPAEVEFADPGTIHPAKPGVATEGASAAAASDVKIELSGDLPKLSHATPDVDPELTIDALQRDIEQRIAADPRDVQAHLERQVINWLRNEPAPDPTAIADLPVADRELISTVIDGLSNLRIALDPANGTAMQRDRVAPILEMAERLRDAGTLSMGQMTLCHAITGFGLYEQMEPVFPAKIPSGWSGQALLYAEVDGFASTLVEDNQWETHLTEQCTLYSNTGLQVWSGPKNDVIDRSNNKRRDFHISKVLRLPEDLPAGAYTLKLTLTDQTSNRLTEQTIGIRISRPEKQVMQ